MSGCAGAGLSLLSLANLPVGSVKNNQGTGDCTPNIGGTQSGSGYDRCIGHAQFKFPENGEFEFALGSPCGMSALVWEYGCGGGGIGGSRCAVKRIGYNADPVQCCIKGTPTFGLNTCDPKFRGSSKPECQTIMKTYCDNASKFFEPECKTWLKNIAQTSPGTADELGNKYCPGSTDLFCGCYNITMPPDVKPTARGVFRCLNETCSGNQQALNTLSCPNVYQDCSISNVDVTLNQSTAQKITIANNCSVGGGSDSPSPSPLAPTPSPSGGGGGGGQTDNSTAIAVFIGAGLIGILIITIVIIFLSSKKK